MTQENMSIDEILDALNESVGETGNAELRQTNALYILPEENSRWFFVGTVADPEEAQQAIDDYFNL